MIDELSGEARSVVCSVAVARCDRGMVKVRPSIGGYLVST